MAKSKIVPMVILQDSREQRPFKFSAYPCKIIKTALKTGDYSIQGYSENGITVERKSHQDIYQSLSHGRERFQKEFQRLSKFKYPVLLIESSLKGLLTPPDYSLMNPSSVVNSVISWGIAFNVQIYFADTRDLAEALCYRIFEKFLINEIRKTKQLLKVS